MIWINFEATSSCSSFRTMRSNHWREGNCKLWLGITGRLVVPSAFRLRATKACESRAAVMDRRRINWEGTTNLMLSMEYEINTEQHTVDSIKVLM